MATRLLEELDSDDAPSSVDDALDLYELKQEVVATQLELPYEVPTDVRGILDMPEKRVFVINTKPVRIRWVGAHEVGHYAIPEHNEILQLCNTFDLSPTARKQLEVEANAFAAEFLFKGDAFAREAQDTRFTIAMLRAISERYGVSYESGFRRFVEQNREPVALLVSKALTIAPQTRDGRITLDFGARPTRLRYASYSPTFARRFSFFRIGQDFDATHPISLATRVGANEFTGSLDHQGDTSQRVVLLQSIRCPDHTQTERRRVTRTISLSLCPLSRRGCRRLPGGWTDPRRPRG